MLYFTFIYLLYNTLIEAYQEGNGYYYNLFQFLVGFCLSLTLTFYLRCHHYVNCGHGVV